MTDHNAMAPPTAYGALAERIRADIISGRLQPGDKLPSESELFDHYDVSRSTAREAMRILASEGLVVTTRGVTGGTFVAHPSPTQLTTSLRTGLELLTASARLSVPMLLEVREMLEIPAAELAAKRRTKAELELIRESLFDPEHVDPAVIFESNRDFHTRILQAARNPLLELVTQPVFRVLDQRFVRENAPHRFWHRVDHDHREILRHVEAGDSAQAGAAATAHLKYLRRAYTRIDTRSSTRAAD